jgi:hypothetical protein
MHDAGKDFSLPNGAKPPCGIALRSILAKTKLSGRNSHAHLLVDRQGGSGPCRLSDLEKAAGRDAAWAWEGND